MVELFHYSKRGNMMDYNNVVEKVREFNRFYMSAMKLLGNHYLGSEYSATEARVLFEIYESEGCNAAHIVNIIQIDKSYLSKILFGYEKIGLVQRIPSIEDRRSYHLYLTEKGKKYMGEWIQKSNNEIKTILQHLSEDKQFQLAQALDTIMKLLQPGGCKDDCNSIQSGL